MSDLLASFGEADCNLESLGVNSLCRGKGSIICLAGARSSLPMLHLQGGLKPPAWEDVMNNMQT